MYTLPIHKTHPDIKLPEYATNEAACFDLMFQVAGKTSVKGYTSDNREIDREIEYRFKMNEGVIIRPGDRLLFPTGLVFIIPPGTSIRLHPRSGLALKKGLILANCEGVIDSDYRGETHIMLTNISSEPQFIEEGMRLAQAEWVPHFYRKDNAIFIGSMDSVTRVGNRTGGYGSTGM